MILDRVASVSFMAALDSEARERVHDEVRQLIAATPELSGLNEARVPYLTCAYWTGRISQGTASPAF